MFCQKCGKKLNEGDRFCDGCGTKIEAGEQPVAVDKPIAPPPTGEYQPYPYYQQKSNTGLKVLVIIMGIIILAGVGFGLWYFVIRDSGNENNTSTNTNTNTGFNTNTNAVINVNTNTNTNTNTVTNTSVGTLGKGSTGNFTYELARTEKQRVIAIFKNNDKEVYDLDIKISFFDSNGNLIGSDDDFLLGIAPGQEFVSEFFEAPSQFATYKIEIEKLKSSYTSHNNDIEVSVNKNDVDEKLILQLKNTSNEEIRSVDIGVVFYRNGKVVGYDSDYETGIKVGATAILSARYPTDEYYNSVEFDNYKVYINSAYSY